MNKVLLGLVVIVGAFFNYSSLATSNIISVLLIFVGVGLIVYELDKRNQNHYED